MFFFFNDTATTEIYTLSLHDALPISHVDDIHAVLEHMTTPEQQPAIHFWRTHPDPGSLTPEAIQRQGLDVLGAIRTALEVVVANHLEERTPVVIEGDFIHPALVGRRAFAGEPNSGRVRGVFLLEDDEDRLVRNFAERDPGGEPQRKRAQ